jgi:predicted NAD/FAD-binding protein
MGKGLSIAVVGSGITGLAAAWLLSKRYQVTLFERDPRAGGHSNTVDVPQADRAAVPVDTGFIVYNPASYPNLIALFDHLGVPTATASMGFSVSLDEGRYEYSGNGIGGLFGQPSNVLRLAHWRMVADTLRFFRESRGMRASNPGDGPTLAAYLSANGYSEAFVTCHILPMAAAIWSAPPSKIMEFPAAAFVRFFENHGLLQVNGRPEWRTVVGGSRQYVRRLLDDMDGRVALGCPAQAIVRTGTGVMITHARGVERFDACVVATHADEALALLGDADERERELLGSFRYTPNRAVLHADPGLMPKRRRLWSSWNYLGCGSGKDASLSVTYWMNKLQPLGDACDLFVTLNPTRAIEPASRIAAFDYSHPLFDQQAMIAQQDLWSLQGRRKTWFCGSYFGYGFHEDGLQAGLAAAEDIGGVRRPWRVAEESGRIHLGVRSSPIREIVREAAE